eukprot:CAMPEP_0184690552 /NCGR_PEP_ID=MMETSP0312-20130426/31293_1 /TAXON_ID=31354 /ORGANISM="Compsopogon coeruleus, Strain SAG 36.94" /LENGTH=63 /DNA_ID=CAMNT_0027148065 /DNA_START=828 /DNA_END=1019 /DNA_ORIENTATION=+
MVNFGIGRLMGKGSFAWKVECAAWLGVVSTFSLSFWNADEISGCDERAIGRGGGDTWVCEDGA